MKGRAAETERMLLDEWNAMVRAARQRLPAPAATPPERERKGARKAVTAAPDVPRSVIEREYAKLRYLWDCWMAEAERRARDGMEEITLEEMAQIIDGEEGWDEAGGISPRPFCYRPGTAPA
jgi:hypothetical protein